MFVSSFKIQSSLSKITHKHVADAPKHNGNVWGVLVGFSI